MSALPATAARLDESAARRLCLVRACETGAGDAALWSPEDRAWATRLARETVPAESGATTFLDERARHACERLLPRKPALAKALQQPAWRPLLVALALALGLAIGLALDGIGSGRHINLLAPPLLGVVLWNLLVYAGLFIGALRTAPAAGPGLRRLVGRVLLRMGRPDEAAAQTAPQVLQRFRAAWAMQSAPLVMHRAAVLLHLGAAAVAAGLIGGLYLRGLVWDYRVGWESTFLEPGAVHALLHAVLAPASALTGFVLPDAETVAALRVQGDVAATESAAPWLHAYAATLALVVVAPRLLLALRAAVADVWRRRRLPLDLSDSYYQQLLLQWHHRATSALLLPHGHAPSPAAALGLRAALAAAFGDDVQLHIAAVTGYGDEDGAAAAPLPAGTTVRAVWVELAATPEAEVHGRFLAALRATPGLVLLLADESAWRRRFAAMPQRLIERRKGWQALADAHGVALACADFEGSDSGAASAAIQAALHSTALERR